LAIAYLSAPSGTNQLMANELMNQASRLLQYTHFLTHRKGRYL